MTRPAQIDTPSRWVLPGCRHWPTRRDRMDKALGLLLRYYKAEPQRDDAELDRLDSYAPAVSARARAARALLRAAGLLPPEGTP